MHVTSGNELYDTVDNIQGFSVILYLEENGR